MDPIVFPDGYIPLNQFVRYSHWLIVFIGFRPNTSDEIQLYALHLNESNFQQTVISSLQSSFT